MPKIQKSRRPVPPVKKRSRPSPVTAAELLLEIGVEELPYQFIAAALSSLTEQAAFFFSFHRLSSGSINTYGTPRRLVLVVEGLATHQAAFTNEAMGPSKSVGFDQAGQPTKAAIGFAKGQGVPVESLRVRQTPRGEYLFAVKEDAGRPTKEVLLEILPQIVGELSFPKAMKWNSTGTRFARPVRWLVALYGVATLPIEVAGITAGNRTEGHRVLGNAKGIVIRDFESYQKGLERQGVTVDPQRRRRTIEEQINAICKSTGFRLNIDADLLDQAVYTTECPNVIIGSFKEAYLDVPEEILITSMKEHQGFFSLRHKETGKLVPHFIAVANNRAKNMGLIREGNERVLAARLADAKFFFGEDRKIRLEDRVKKLAGVTFHQKLGTMEQKVERVIQLAVKLAETQQDPGFVENCRRAAQLSKADLLTGIVGEFPALQGVMGGHYASHDGEPEAVSRAIREHYLPHAMEGALPQTLEGKILSLADRLDTVVGFFSVGMIPTGSEDPFALRRHAMAIVLIYIDLDWPTDLNRWVGTSHEILRAQGCSSTSASHADGKAVVAGVNSFFADRLRFYSKTARGLRDDVIEAVLRSAKHEFIPADLLKRMEALQGVRDLSEFDSLMIGFKRAHRLVEKEQWDRKPVESARFKDPTELALYQAIEEERKKMKSAIIDKEYGQALDALVRLKPAIDAFFTAVMVNAEDPAVRSNRLSLLQEVDDFFNSFADFSQIVVQGG